MHLVISRFYMSRWRSKIWKWISSEVVVWSKYGVLAPQGLVFVVSSTHLWNADTARRLPTQRPPNIVTAFQTLSLVTFIKLFNLSTVLRIYLVRSILCDSPFSKRKAYFGDDIKHNLWPFNQEWKNTYWYRTGQGWVWESSSLSTIPCEQGWWPWRWGCRRTWPR